MNKKDAAKAWHVKEKDVKRICDHMQIDINNIPEDLQPVYVPAKELRKDPHRFYIYILEVINNPLLVLEDVDETIIQSCVTQLHKEGLIVPKKNADPESTNYRDYVLSADREKFYTWMNSKSTMFLEL